MPFGDKVRQLDEQVATVVRRAVEDLREEVRKRLDEATDDLRRRLGEVAPELPDSFVNEEDLQRIAEEAAAPSREALSDAEGRGARAARAALREAVAALDRSTTQSSILEALLAESSRYAPRAAVLLVRDGGIAGWGARGFEGDREAARAVALSAQQEPWSSVVGGGPARALAAARCASLVSQLDSPMPLDAAVIPLVLRDRVAALLYADRREAGESIDLDALQLLTYAAGLALETLALRERSSTATLLPAAEAGAPQLESQPEPERRSEPEPQLEAEPDTVAPVEAELEEAAIAAAETEVAPEAPVEDEAWATPEAKPEEAGAATVTLEAWEEQELETPEPAAEEAEVADEVGTEEAGGEPWASGIEVTPSEGSFEPVETLEPVEAPEEIEAVDEVEIELEGSEESQLSSDLLQPVEEEEVEPVERPVAGFESLDERVLGEAALEEAPELEEEAPGVPAAQEAEETEEPEARGEAIPWRTEESEAFEPEEAEIELTPEEVAGAAEIELAESEAEEEEEPGAPLEEAAPAEAEPAAAPEPEIRVEPEAEAEEAAAEATDEPEGAVPPPLPRAPSIGQVEPPADVEGPGWAFSSSRAPVSKDDEAAHEEARRLARLLVSEIQLYNQDEVEEGRRNRDIYERLRDDIDRSRQLYEDRVETSVRESTDYFYQELVRQLAAGDAKALGI